jgi:hypothetical protein
MNKFESLLEYKKSLKDWHYDPMIPSNDCQYVGTIQDFDFSTIKPKLENKEPEPGVTLYPEDFVNGKSIPDQLSPDSVGAGKLDHVRHGYTKHNTCYTQWIDNRDTLPDEFIKIRSLCNFKYAKIACFRQDPGHTNPWHFDTYQGTVKKGNLTGDDTKKVKRYLLFLEDWHWGHILQVGNNMLSNWKAGDIYTWDYGMYHLSSNAGIVPKWTCQITGYPTEESLHLSTNFKFKIK